MVPAGRAGRRLAVSAPTGRLSPLAQAYSTAAAGWARGPERVYARMAADLRHGTRTAPTFDDAVAVHRIIAAIEEAAGESHRIAVS